MNKIVASVGIVALGASSLQTAFAQLAGPDTSKPWNVSATLRGFYDDNVATLGRNAGAPAGSSKDTFGFEVSPTFSLLWSPQEQTTFSLGLLYSYKYYDKKPPFDANHDDQDFTFNAGVNHAFSENLKVRVSDSFVIGQEPDVLRAGNTFATFQRISGDNIRNFGSVGLDAQLTPKFGLGLGYDNAYYNYKAKGETLQPTSDFIYNATVVPSPAGALNRDENRAHIEGLYQVQPETKGLIGYQFTDISYLSDEYIGGFVSTIFPTFFPPVDLVKARDRDVREHTLYVGGEHTFMPELTGSVRVGASYSDYYNNPNTKSSWSPYVLASLKYNYAKESFVEAGFSYDRSATDVVGLFSSGSFTQDAESAVVYASINHRIMPQLFGSLLGQFQNNIYNGGFYDNQNDQYYLLGVNFEYRFNPNLAADLGYNYDRLESNIPGRAFDRNRVYIGLTASY